MRLAIVAVLAAIIGACATYGAPISQEAISRISTGSTTKSEVLQWFGQPVTQGYDSDGNEYLTWSYFNVGPLGSNMQQQVLLVLLSKDGKVARYNVQNTGQSAQQNGADK